MASTVLEVENKGWPSTITRELFPFLHVKVTSFDLSELAEALYL